MNSTIFDDFTHEHLASEAAKCIENFQARTQGLTALHKELLEINLSITAYIEESKRRLKGFRLDLAHKAKSSQKVVEILTEKSNMSSSISSPRKRSKLINNKSPKEDNNNTKNKFSEHQQARTFIQWYKHMIDNDRQNLTLYLSDDATLEWFGRTIKTRKKVSAFLKFDMQCSQHDFTTIESIEKLQERNQWLQRQDDRVLASPLNSPELVQIKRDRPSKRKLRSNCNSPEWAEGCNPDDETNNTERKRLKKKQTETVAIEDNNCDESNQPNNKKIVSHNDTVISSKGDGMLQNRLKRKIITVTPPNCEVGQGDCLPSTSGTDSNKSHDALNAQLPKLAVECNGFIEFTRSRNNRNIDSMKWERKCKMQISYSEDPLNVGEYIIWALRYTDESRCRRNLLTAFEEVAKEEELKNV